MLVKKKFFNLLKENVMVKTKSSKLNMKKVLLATVLLGSVMGTTIAYVGNTAYAAESYITGSQNTSQSWLTDETTGWEYDIVDKDGTKCIIRPSATMLASADVTVPDKIRIPNQDNPEEFTEYTVVAIMSNAWKGNTILKSVSLPASVVELGDSAFEGCTSLTTINGIEHVSMLGKTVFKDCTSITNMTLGDIDTLLYNTFENCTGLTEIKIGNINEIKGDGAWFGIVAGAIGQDHAYGPFNGCTNLKKITLGNVANVGSDNVSGSSISGSVIKGYDCTFAGLDNLETVIVGDYPAITEWMGLSGDSVKSIKFGHVDTIENKVLSAVGAENSYSSALGNGLLSAEFESVGEIKRGAFKGLENLNYVDIGVVEEIPMEAFYGCENLQHFDLSGAKSIGESAFEGSGLLEVETGDLTSLGKNAFKDCKYLKSIKFGDVPTITNDHYTVVGTVYSSSFSGCKNLEYFECGDVETFPTNALANVSDKLTTVVVGNVGSIGKEAFANNTNLEFFSCGTVGSISSDAFNNTKIAGLATITLHNANGEGVTQAKVAKGTLATSMAKGENGTKIFTGWYTDESLSEPYTGIILGDMELYAGYIDEVYYVNGEGDRVGEGEDHTVTGQDELAVHLSSVPTGEITYQWYWVKPGSNYGNGFGYTPPARINISGANGQSYTIADEYKGYAIGCEVISNGYVMNISNVTVEGEPSDELPVVTLNSIEIYGDNRKEGGVLRTILDPNAANGTYQWYRSDSKDGVYTPIDGANDSKYTITADDVGKYVKVEFTGTEYSDGQKIESEPAYVFGELQSLSGAYITDKSTDKKVGDVLEATAKAIVSGEVGDVPAEYLTYQWYRDPSVGGTFGNITDTAVAIDGANNSTYKLTKDDLGMTIFVAITGKEDCGFTGTEVSDKISKKVAPTIAEQVDAYKDNMDSNSNYKIANTYGNIDTIWTAKLTVPDSATVSYQWYRDSGVKTSGFVADTAEEMNNFDTDRIPETAEPIDGANSNTYTATAADVGYRLFLVVKGTGDTAYASRTYSTKEVTKGSLTGQKIEGINKVGETLTMTTDYDEYLKDGVISYQWYRSTSKTSPANANIGSSYEIDGAVNKDYTITDEDIGNYIHCVAYTSNSNNGWSPTKNYADVTYNTEKVTAEITSADIEGQFKVGETLTVSTNYENADISVAWYKNDGDDSLYNEENWELLDTNDGTLELTSAEEGYWIKAIVTGQNDYTGTVECSRIGRVISSTEEEQSVEWNKDNVYQVGNTIKVDVDPYNPDSGEDNFEWFKVKTVDSTDSGEQINIFNYTNELYLTGDMEGYYIRACVGDKMIISPRIEAKDGIEITSADFSDTELLAGNTISVVTNPEEADTHIEWYKAYGSPDASLQYVSTGDSLELTDDMNGYYIIAKVTGINDYTGYFEVVSDEAVHKKQVESASLSYTGELKANQTTINLTVNPSEADVNIVWYRVKDGVPTQIQEGGTSYNVVDSDVGYQIKAVVTGKNIWEGTAEDITSSTVEAEFSGTVDNAKLTGDTVVGEKLKLSYEPSEATVEITWSRYDEDSMSLIKIEEAANQKEYTLTSEDVGYKIFVQVVGTGNYTGSTNTQTSTVVTDREIIDIESAEFNKSGLLKVTDTLSVVTDPAEATVTVDWYYLPSYSITNPEAQWTPISGQNGRDLDLTNYNDKFIKAVVHGTGDYRGDFTLVTELPVVNDEDNLIEVTATEITSNISGQFTTNNRLTANPTPSEAMVTTLWYKSKDKSAPMDEWEFISGSQGNRTLTLTENEDNYYIMAVQYGRADYYGKVSDITDEPIIGVNEIKSAHFDDTDLEVGNTLTLVTEPSEAQGTVYWYKATDNESIWKEDTYGNKSIDFSKCESITWADRSSKSIELKEDLVDYYIVAYIYSNGSNGWKGAIYNVTDEPVKASSGSSEKTEIDSVTLTGKPEVGETLEVVVKPNGATVDYEWIKVKDGEETPIEGANGNSYEIKPEDEGYEIKVVVTGNGDYTGEKEFTSETVTNNSTETPDEKDITVKFNSTHKVGEDMSVEITPADATVTIQWKVSEDGSKWEDISGENDKTYTVKDSDEGKYIKVVITGTGDYDGYTYESSAISIDNKETETPSTNPGERIPTSQEHVDYTTIDTDDVYNGYDQGVEVYVSQGQDIAIRLPFKTVLDGTKGHENKADFEVEVRANISGADNIKVVPETEFTMTTVGKKPIDGTVEIAQTEYNIAKDGEEELSRGKVVNGKVSVENLSAGHWEGDFDWEIKVEGLKLDDSEESAGNTEVTP